MNWFTRSTICRNVSVGEITPNPQQPRVVFEKKALQELADSMAATGLIQPIVVRPTSHNSFVIVDGERRWRAAQLLGWREIMAVINPRDGDDRDDAVEAIVANLHRRDLNPVEFAIALQRLREQMQGDNQELGRLLGLNPSVISNKIRLLRLWPEAQDALRDGKISERQAAALLPVCDLPAEIKVDTDSLLTRAMSGVSSTELRNNVETVIYNATWPLGVGLTHFDTNECSGCPLKMTVAKQLRCGDIKCRNKRETAWELAYLTAASAACGLPFVTTEERQIVRLQLLESDEIPKCDKTRIRIGSFGYSVPGFPHARLACAIGTESCRCVPGVWERVNAPVIRPVLEDKPKPPPPPQSVAVSDEQVLWCALVHYRDVARETELPIVKRLMDVYGGNHE